MDYPFRKLLIDTLLFSSLFFIVAGVSLYLSGMPNVITKLWLSNTIGIVLLLRHKTSAWLIPLMGVGVVNFLVYILFGNDLPVSCYFTVIHLVEIMFVAWILKQYRIVDYFDRNIKSALILLVTIIFIAPAISATLGAFFFALNKPVYFWRNWFVGDGICIVVLLPIALCLMKKMWCEITFKSSVKLMLWGLITASLILPTLLYLPYAFIMIVVPLLIAAIYTSVFFTILIASFNLFSIFTLYNAGIYVPLITSPFEQSILVYIPATMLFTLPYLLVVFMSILKKSKDDMEQNERLFRSAIESSAVGMALVSTDGYWFIANDALCKMLGYSKSELKKLKVQDITHPEDLPQTLRILKNLKTGKVKVYNTEKRYISKRGRHVWVRLSVNPLLNKYGASRYYIAHVENITKNKKLELANVALTNRLYDEKEHLRILLTSIVDSVIATDEKGRITFMNAEAEKITGWTFDEARGFSNEAVFMIINTKNDVLGSPITHCLENKAVLVELQDALLINKAGEKYNIQYSISLLHNKEQKLIGAEVVFQNITRATSLQEELSYNATHDSLTGLLNRREFEKILEQSVHEFKTKGIQYILCYLDLDFFKVVNDSAGHMAGDALLQEVAGLFHQRLRKLDVLARLGGDEFGILLLNSSLTSAKEICQQLIDLVNSVRFRWKDRIFRAGVSIGMVLMSDTTLTAGQLLSEADVACYSAKTEGRNRVFVYQADQVESLEHHHGIIVASIIEDALEGNRIILYAQKIVNLMPGEPESLSFEILLRMINEKQELIDASAFVVIAERYNLMVKIDRWVLIQILAIHDKKLHKLANTSFSINLSASSLNAPGFLTFLLSLIEKSAIPPERICFEITETAAMSHISKTITIVSELQRIGCKVALDDFGVGLSSFSYVKNFSVDIVKIDGSFIKSIVGSEVDRTIVQTINEMAHRLGMKTVAEYVENKAILKAITAIGIDFAQGFALGKPEPLDKLIRKKRKQ